MNSQPAFLFLTYFKLSELWPCYSKACKPNNFGSRDSVKLSLTNILGLCSNCVDCESLFESNSPDSLVALCETNLDRTIYSVKFSVRGYLPLIRKDSSIHGLTVYMKEEFLFARDLSLENSENFYLCFWLALFHSVSPFFLLYRSPFSSFCTFFDSILSNIDEVLLTNSSANVFVFGNSNVHHKD